MISYRFVPISSQKGVLFLETPGMYILGGGGMCHREGLFVDFCCCLSANANCKLKRSFTSVCSDDLSAGSKCTCA